MTQSPCEPISTCYRCAMLFPICAWCASSGTCRSPPSELQVQSSLVKVAYSRAEFNSSYRQLWSGGNTAIVEDASCGAWIYGQTSCSAEDACKIMSPSGCGYCIGNRQEFGGCGFCLNQGPGRPGTCLPGIRSGKFVFSQEANPDNHCLSSDSLEADHQRSSTGETFSPVAFPVVGHPVVVQNAWLYGGGEAGAACIQKCKMAQAQHTSLEGVIFVGDMSQNISYEANSKCSWEIWPASWKSGGTLRLELRMISFRTMYDTVLVFALDRQERSNSEPSSIPLPNDSILSVSCPSYEMVSGWPSHCATATVEATSPVMIVFQSFGGQPVINSFGAWQLSWLYTPPVLITTGTTSASASVLSSEPSWYSNGSSGELPISWLILLMIPLVFCVGVFAAGLRIGLGARATDGRPLARQLQAASTLPEAPLEAPVDMNALENAMPRCRPRIIGCPVVPEEGVQFWEQQQKQQALAQEERDAHSDIFGICSVCLTDFCRGDVFRQLPCGHDFHKTCIDMWLGRKGYCPICRRPVVSSASTAAEANSSLSSMSSVNQLADLSPSDLLRLRGAQQSQRELDAGLAHSPGAEHADGEVVVTI
ncbi:unnamed protein product [Polarella glacialis]|uniref:RING-type domain-containing protein n=1 Tax=Polarella glacialis TaxID=89957 RepID=A0A813I1P1_POLGL|nr:unnamed protein product [Polarella glacialis]